jgi:hypothetical protein
VWTDTPGVVIVPFEGAELNERVVRGGHYLIVTPAPCLRGTALVACPNCGLLDRQPYDGHTRDFQAVAGALAGAALARYADPTCEGVRLQLLAEAVMES